MSEAEERRELEARVAAGARLVQVQRGDLRTIKQLQGRCQDVGVPSMVTSGPPGG